MRFFAMEGYQNHVLSFPLDVSDPDETTYTAAVEQTVKRFGRINVLVNNAGYGRITNFEETSEESVKALFEVNLFGLMRVTRAVLPVMRRQRSGYILNVSSGAGYVPGPAVYHTSKFTVTGFSTSLDFEAAPFGIKVSNIVPGLVHTGFYDRGVIRTEADIHIKDYDHSRWQNDFMKANSHHKQLGDPAKIAKLFVDAVEAGVISLHIPVTANAVEVLNDWQKDIAVRIEKWRNKASITSLD